MPVRAVAYTRDMRNPEDFGLETIGTINMSEGGYDFDVVTVFKERRGRYWIGRDSGCSCTYAFEYHEDINDFDGPHNKAGLRSRLAYICDNGRSRHISWGQFRNEAGHILSRLT